MRLFIAISPADEIRKALVQTQDVLSRHGVYGSPVPAENLHMTMTFIGEYPDPDQVLGAMGNVVFRPFPITLNEIGLFNNNVLWAGVHESEPLMKLVKCLRYELAKAGIPFDNKLFMPHITLLRNVDDTRGVPETNVPAVSMTVGSISLFRSDRVKGSMIYTEIGSVSAAGMNQEDQDGLRA